VAEILVCLLACIQIMIILPHGTWVERKKPTPSLSQMLAAKKVKLDYLPLPGSGAISPDLRRHVQQTFLEPFIGKLYDKYRIAADSKQAYQLMAQGRAADEVIVENYRAVSDSDKADPQQIVISDRVALTYSAFNRLVFDVRASQPSFFAMGYPNTGHWKASVNGSDVRIYRANGVAHAVEVPAGRSSIEFRYGSPASVWGMVLSCSTLALIGIYFGVFVLKKPAGLGIALSAVVVAAAGFFYWYQSLYTGDNLDTAYVWQKDTQKRMVNLAYGKPTKMSSSLHTNHNYLVTANRAVDGDRTAGSGFFTKRQHHPWWLVDLQDSKSLASIHVYESQNHSAWNNRPLVIALSPDGEKWHKVSVIQSDNNQGRIQVDFSQPQTGRYVLIQAAGNCHLSLDEVEIYAPLN
jgi:hypothetical protein